MANQPSAPNKFDLSLIDGLPWDGKNGVMFLIPDELWIEIPGYVCINCRFPAFHHPFTNRIWGCRNYDCPRRPMSTASAGVYFDPRKTTDPEFYSIDPLKLCTTANLEILKNNKKLVPGLYQFTAD